VEVRPIQEKKAMNELQENVEVKAKEAVLYMYINCEKV
jgi:hypothetical protein